ncbi:5-formyltetrahydrofolate cyclo-ligase [Rufibacter immobilis]|uniref:5-formyltetrahydrofolate cyclo-ligase n=1 Tax=Rufibacter immobilis TaxID=1348778 RepID=A0A3M9MX32_9BACT|nr:5-formyltetrahydrofolate cyclo-ligase [Rufibacter immobilis]RNI30112.1 5-formyltetrahydrofolate cyclo-ligase [Rufibacter immobilis]
MALKADLRKAYLNARRQYPLEELEAKSQQICDLFFLEFALKAGQTVHSFLPMQQHRELNTWYIIRQLWQQQVQVAVPVSNSADFSMTHFLFTPDTGLQENKWGIPEPVGALPIPEAEIDLVLVPLLAFDLQGHRVGYGKGFYDRFMALLPKTTQKVGLSLEAPVEVIDDIHVNDLTLDAVVTPSQVYNFQNV